MVAWGRASGVGYGLSANSRPCRLAVLLLDFSTSRLLDPFDRGNEHHRSIGFAYEFFGDAAEEPAPDPAATM